MRQYLADLSSQFYRHYQLVHKMASDPPKDGCVPFLGSLHVLVDVAREELHKRQRSPVLVPVPLGFWNNPFHFRLISPGRASMHTRAQEEEHDIDVYGTRWSRRKTSAAGVPF